MVGSASVTTRMQLARELRLAPSTISARVNELVDRGLLKFGASAASSGGRRATILQLNDAEGVYVAADLGGHHARLGLFDGSGRLLVTRELKVKVSDGPEACLTPIAAGLRALAKGLSTAPKFLAAGISLPGPVTPDTHQLDTPARLPGWSGFDVEAWLQQQFGCLAVVGNDANFAALGAHYSLLSERQHSITVKAGTGIGSGIIVAGSLYEGANGAAGDVTHTRVAAAENCPCSCGNVGCLETIASGASIVRLLAQDGADVSSTHDVLRLAEAANPRATTAIRAAGMHLGDALASIVNFFNPDTLFLTGALASSELFIPAVRSQIYERCHPLVTRNLTIQAAPDGSNVGLRGIARTLAARFQADAIGPARAVGSF